MSTQFFCSLISFNSKEQRVNIHLTGHVRYHPGARVRNVDPRSFWPQIDDLLNTSSEDMEVVVVIMGSLDRDRLAGKSCVLYVSQS